MAILDQDISTLRSLNNQPPELLAKRKIDAERREKINKLFLTIAPEFVRILALLERTVSNH